MPLRTTQEEGVLQSDEEVANLAMDYIGPALDTAMSRMIDVLGRHPRSWSMLLENPALIPSAAREATRMAQSLNE